tara:strand:+ start:4027 stop:5115 length:1089 start_codon:yes stop_codon:yes gene_type:complete
MHYNFRVDKDIKKAETLPSKFYMDQSIFDLVKEKIFSKSWHWIGHENLVKEPNSIHPITLMENFLDEPILLTKDNNGVISCLSNVCTHRGNILALNSTKAKKLVCMYHGRRFNLNGHFEFMPEFEEAKNFPRECDNLFNFPIEKWGPFLFMGIDPQYDIKKIIKKINTRVGFLPLDDFLLREDLRKDYIVDANWALYCDNYLEGFHIPFVHEDLNKELDYGDYDTEIYDYFNVQVGYTNDSSIAFDFPKNHMDSGKNIAAYYFWIFPNMMFNFYPWGLSINIVKPISVNKTKVSFIPYVYDSNKLDSGAGSILDKVEKEDEFVVQNVQRGMRSNYYDTGRFSPIREKGVHHFHLLVSDFLNK